MAESPATKGIQLFLAKIARMLAGQGFQGSLVLFPDNSNLLTEGRNGYCQ
jgi:hypothetical protein